MVLEVVMTPDEGSEGGRNEVRSRNPGLLAGGFDGATGCNCLLQGR